MPINSQSTHQLMCGTEDASWIFGRKVSHKVILYLNQSSCVGACSQFARTESKPKCNAGVMPMQENANTNRERMSGKGPPKRQFSRFCEKGHVCTLLFLAFFAIIIVVWQQLISPMASKGQRSVILSPSQSPKGGATFEGAKGGQSGHAASPSSIASAGNNAALCYL